VFAFVWSRTAIETKESWERITERWSPVTSYKKNREYRIARIGNDATDSRGVGKTRERAASAATVTWRQRDKPAASRRGTRARSFTAWNIIYKNHSWSPGNDRWYPNKNVTSFSVGEVMIPRCITTIMWWAITTVLPLCGPPAAVRDTDPRPLMFGPGVSFLATTLPEIARVSFDPLATRSLVLCLRALQLHVDHKRITYYTIRLRSRHDQRRRRLPPQHDRPSIMH